jgi:hypothetical protein
VAEDGNVSTTELREAMEATRRSIQDTVEELRHRVGEAMDWRSYIERYPMASLTMAAGTGIIIGRRLGSLAEPGTDGGILHRSLSQVSHVSQQVIPASGRKLSEPWARAGSRLESIVNRLIDEAGDTVERVLVPTLISGLARLLSSGDRTALGHPRPAMYTDHPAPTEAGSGTRTGSGAPPR